MASKRVKDGPHWVKAWISELSALTDQFRDIETGAVDFEALGREEYHFRMALSRRDFTNSERARKVWEDAVGKYQQRIKAASEKNPQDAPNGNAGVDRKSATSCDQFTADGDTREGSLDGKSGTSANLYGDASRREAGDESATVSGNNKGRSPDVEGSTRYPGSAGERPKNLGSAVSTHTISTDGPRQSENAAAEATAPSSGGSAATSYAQALECLSDKGEQSAKTRDSRGSGRYQPPSLGPEDGKIHDQVPDKVSTKPTGGHIFRSSSRSPVGDVLSLAYSGEFGNVRLTQEQYAQLGIKFGNQQKLNRAIDSLSCQIENGERNPQNHYAELVKWAAYRDDMEEKKELEESKPKMTNMEKSWIAAMKRVEEM